MSDHAPLLGRIRNPEHTGENRCVPCTIVNVTLAVVASGLVWVVVPELAVLVFGCSLLAIYLRGYLVPGTPTLTKRFLPDRILAIFDKGPAASRTDEQTWDTLEKLEYEREHAIDPERYLRTEGVVSSARDGSERYFTDAFADSLERELDRLDAEAVDRATIADVFDTDPEAVTVADREYPAVEVDRRTRKWPGDAALVADVAVHRALSERADGWLDVPIEQRLTILEKLRSFHDACPLCSGPVAYSSDTVESCCRSYDVRALRCGDCGEPLREFGPNESIPDGEHRFRA